MGANDKIHNARSEVARKTCESKDVSHFMTLADQGRCGGASGGQRRALKILGLLPELIDNMSGLDSEAATGVLRILAAGATEFPSLRHDIEDIVETYQGSNHDK